LGLKIAGPLQRAQEPETFADAAPETELRSQQEPIENRGGQDPENRSDVKAVRSENVTAESRNLPLVTPQDR